MTGLDPTLILFAAPATFLGLAALILALQSRGHAASARAATREAAEMRERLGAAEQENAGLRATVSHLAPLEGRLQAAETLIRDQKAELARRDAHAEAERRNFEARQAELTTLRGEMAKDFENLAGSALGKNREAFLALADEVFKKHRAETGADVEARRKAVEELVRPIAETLQLTRSKLEQIEKERADSFGQLRQQMMSVGQEASRLTQALRANPGTRGRWGEESLRNALELAGLSPHCDFDTQATFSRLDSSIRPDCVIKLPGGRNLVVDAKAPISAYLDAVDAPDEAARSAGMKRHADSLRQHMLSLSRKEYSQTVSAHLAARPDFVAMYVPGENFFAAAIERNGDLFAEAIGRGVFIVTPTTLIALAKVIALNWQQESIAQNARAVAELGRDLYARLCTLGGHVGKLAEGLEKSVKCYNAFVGSLEGSVLPQARKFRELQVVDSSKEIALIEPLALEFRQPLRGRDLLFGADELGLEAAE